VDVNINRLDESLKFLEDVVRFSIKNRELLNYVRAARKEFLSIKKRLPLIDIIISRESQQDLGRPARFDAVTKKSPEELILANLMRAKESSRILEEISKSDGLNISQQIKELRFKIYDIEKKLASCLKKEFDPKIYAIIDEKYLGTYKLEEMISILKDNGATMIQLRIKSLTDYEFYRYATKIKKLLSKSQVKFIVNNRLDVARAANADGVHLGQHDMPIRSARTILGEAGIIAASAHNLKEALTAQTNGADYLGVGSIFQTQTKPEAKISKIETLKAICKGVSIPIIGIGGITDKNFLQVLNAGASGVALSAYLFEGNLKKNLKTLTRAIQGL